MFWPARRFDHPGVLWDSRLVMSKRQGSYRPRRSRLLNPVVWISIGQVVWITVLVGWIFYVIDRNDRLAELAAAVRVDTSGADWSGLVWGVLLLVLLFVVMLFLTMAVTRAWSENRAIHRFVSTVSHELRTPLASIRLYHETMLAHTDLSEAERKDFFNIILADVERLSASIDAILAASRIERRGVRYDLESLDLQDYLERYLQERKGAVALRQRRLELAELEPVQVRASRQALDTILNNLVENAVRYSVTDTAIALGLRREKGRALLTVRDQGRGIKTAELKNLFKMFYRSPSSTDTQGTGLGLYIVHSLVKAMDGEIQLYSDGLERGTTVTISLADQGQTKEG